MRKSEIKELREYVYERIGRLEAEIDYLAENINNRGYLKDEFVNLVYIQNATNAALKTLCIYLGIDYTELSKSFVRNLNYVEIGNVSEIGFLSKLIKLTKADEYVLAEEKTKSKIKLIKKSK